MPKYAPDTKITGDKPGCVLSLRWKDGRLFRAKVQVWAGPRYLYRTHAEDAHHMCVVANTAIPIDEGTKEQRSQIGAIMLLNTPLERPKPNPNFNLTSYSGGQRLIFKERLGPKDSYEGCWCYRHKAPEPA